MKNSSKIFLGILIFLLVAIFTNPSNETHSYAVKKWLIKKVDLNGRLNERLNAGNDYEKTGAALGYSLASGVIDKYLDNMISIDNYGVISISSIQQEDQTKYAAISAFGNVFILEEWALRKRK